MSARPSPIPRTRGWGVGLALVTAVISGFSIFVNAYGVKAKAFGNATLYTTAKNLVAAVLLFGLASVATARRSAEGFTKPRGTQWVWLAAVGVIGGGIPFILFFEGLARASSTHAAFIQKTLVVWVAILAVWFLRERLSAWHLAAIGLLVGGQLALDGGVRGFAFGRGELMIAIATLLWSVEIVIVKRLSPALSSLTIGVARMSIGIVVLAGWTALSGAGRDLAAAGARDWGWALATGVLLACYVATWFAALARAQATDVTAVLVLGAVITALLQSGIQNAALAPHALGLGLIAIGTVLVTLLGVRRPATHATEISP
ncbi:MAG: DMT family transporter [Actinomycetota bacterium]